MPQPAILPPRIDPGGLPAADPADLRPDAELCGRRLSGVALTGAKLRGLVLRECLLEGCTLLSCDLTRVELLDCQWRGANWDCSILERVRLTGCDLSEGWLSGCRLRRFEVRDCRFIKTGFFKTDLEGIDFRTCRLEGITVSDTGRELRGAIVGPEQAVELARLLGLVVRWD